MKSSLAIRLNEDYTLLKIQTVLLYITAGADPGGGGGGGALGAEAPPPSYLGFT